MPNGDVMQIRVSYHRLEAGISVATTLKQGLQCAELVRTTRNEDGIEKTWTLITSIALFEFLAVDLKRLKFWEMNNHLDGPMMIDGDSWEISVISTRQEKELTLLNVSLTSPKIVRRAKNLARFINTAGKFRIWIYVSTRRLKHFIQWRAAKGANGDGQEY